MSDILDWKKTTRYLIYWHKVANSGVWGKKVLDEALSMAEDLAEQDGVYKVIIFDQKHRLCHLVKGDSIGSSVE